MSDHPYRRQEGDKVIYSPEQTERYKSMWERYQKSLCMKPDFVEEADETTVYRFNSPRSPSGTWDVIASGGSSAISDSRAEVVWNSTEGDLGIDYSPSKGSFLGGINSSFQGTGTLKNGTLPFPKVRMIRGGIFSSVSISSDDPSILIESIKYRFSWNLAIAPIGGAIANSDSVCNIFIDYSPGSPSIQGESAGSREVTRSLPGSSSINFLITVEQEILANASGAGVAISVSQDFKILEINGQVVANDDDYNCTCPDFSKKIDGFANKFQDDSPRCDHDNNRNSSNDESIYPSEETPRDWSDSKAGTKEYCKHILAVMRFRGEPIPRYTDIPVDARNTNNYTEPLVNDGNPRTEEFDFKAWDNVPGRTRKPKDIQRPRNSWGIKKTKGFRGW